MPKPAKRLDLTKFPESPISVESIPPVFGDNYRPGYLGFLIASRLPAGTGVGFVTGWSRLSDLAVSRVLVVVGEEEAIEASVEKGVVRVSLKKLFDDPATCLVFRKPRKLTPECGNRIAGVANAQVGTRFDHLLQAAHVLESSFLRRWLFSAFSGSSDRFLGRLLTGDNRWISSEFAAHCLDAQPEYADRGILARAHYAMSPQALFEDSEIFAAWKVEAPSRKKFRKVAEPVSDDQPSSL